MATVAQVVDMAASRMGLVGEGQELPSYQSEDMNQSYVEIYAQLDIKDMAVWDFDEDIPDEYASHVANMVAWNRITNYPVDPQRYQMLALSNQIAIPEILELQTSNTYQTPEADYF